MFLLLNAHFGKSTHTKKSLGSVTEGFNMLYYSLIESNLLYPMNVLKALPFDRVLM